MIPARDALARLREGNRRFVSDALPSGADVEPRRRTELAAAQEPFAIILGCSDSRVPAEIVFDQGLGDLFVIRVAGNIVAPSQVGSVEFAAARFGTRLVVVLGHSQCGAITATLEELQRPTREPVAQPARRSWTGCGRRSRRCCAPTSRHDPDALVRAGGARQHPRLGQPPAPRIGDPGAADRGRRAAGGRRRVLAGDRRGGLLRRGRRPELDEPANARGRGPAEGRARPRPPRVSPALAESRRRSAERLVQRRVGRGRVGAALRELVLRIELGALGVEHLEEVGHAPGKAEPGQLGRPLAGRGGVLDLRHPLPRRAVAGQRRLHFLLRQQHRLAVDRLGLHRPRRDWSTRALTRPRFSAGQVITGPDRVAEAGIVGERVQAGRR